MMESAAYGAAPQRPKAPGAPPEPPGLPLETLVQWFEDAEESSNTARAASERDRDYYDNKQLTAAELAELVTSIWCANAEPGEQPGGRRYVVCTGGEPLLQLDPPLIEALHAQGFEVAVETNGTVEAPAGLDWICVSPKANADLVLTKGNELKLVYPQDEAEAQPERFIDLDFQHFFLQPKDDPHAARNVQAAAQYCLKNPQWRLSLQTHKLTGLP